MKTIIIEGEEYQYKVKYTNGENYSWADTYFYKGTCIERHYKYLLFGPIIEKIVPKPIFSIDINIEDPSYSKEVVKAKIDEKLVLLHRQAEIKAGKII